MKRTFLAFLAALALAAGSANGAAPAATEITVSGTGSVTLPPTVATVDAAVETNAPDAGGAVSQNNAIYSRIVAALEKAGVDRPDITLAYYNVSYNPPPKTPPAGAGGERYGYTVSRGFSVKVRDMSRAGRVADACTRSGATAINGVSFGLSDPSAARWQAMQKAVADARAQARAIAGAAGLHIVSIKSIDLGGGVSPPGPLMRMNATGAAPTQFDQSNVNVSVSVSVTFTAEP